MFNLGVGLIAVLPRRARWTGARRRPRWPRGRDLGRSGGDRGRARSAVRFVLEPDGESRRGRARRQWRGPSSSPGGAGDGCSRIRWSAPSCSRDGEVVGEGWHAEFGDAPRRADRARGGGRRGSRRDAGRHARALRPPGEAAAVHRRDPRAPGVRRVVVAVADPNPVAAGGAARLRAGWGRRSRSACEREAAEAQNAVFLHRLPRSRRGPSSRSSSPPALDGRIADADGRSRWISRSAGARATCTGFAPGSTRSRSAGAPRGPTIPRSPCAGAVEPRVAATAGRLRRRRPS